MSSPLYQVISSFFCCIENIYTVPSNFHLRSQFYLRPTWQYQSFWLVKKLKKSEKNLKKIVSTITTTVCLSLLQVNFFRSSDFKDPYSLFCQVFTHFLKMRWVKAFFSLSFLSLFIKCFITFYKVHFLAWKCFYKHSSKLAKKSIFIFLKMLFLKKICL